MLSVIGVFATSPWLLSKGMSTSLCLSFLNCGDNNNPSYHLNKFK